MEVVKVKSELQEFLCRVRPENSIGLVPTMGALHEGHLSLIRIARAASQKTVVSIFVNPLQFDNKEDYLKYSINLDQDLALLQVEGVDVVFAPNISEIYPINHQTRIFVSKLMERYEGEFRRGHFEGVATVVAILLNIVQPHVAVFGEKDFQQLRIVEQMVADLGMPLKILRAPLVRSSDGLALSSRNNRLTAKGRNSALIMSKGLLHAKEKVEKEGEVNVATLKEHTRKIFSKEVGFALEYLELVDENELLPVSFLEKSKPYRFLCAGYVEGVRLIDNVSLKI